MPNPICSSEFCFNYLNTKVEVKEGKCLDCLTRKKRKVEKYGNRRKR